MSEKLTDMRINIEFLTSWCTTFRLLTWGCIRSSFNNARFGRKRSGRSDIEGATEWSSEGFGTHIHCLKLRSLINLEYLIKLLTKTAHARRQHYAWVVLAEGPVPAQFGILGKGKKASVLSTISPGIGYLLLSYGWVAWPRVPATPVRSGENKRTTDWRKKFSETMKECRVSPRAGGKKRELPWQGKGVD